MTVKVSNPLVMSMKEFLDWVSRAERTSLKLGSYPTDGILG